jgi:hypothetical protein
MPYKLRFVQRFRQDKIKEYLELENKFVELEQENPEFPKGKRYLPYTGREPSNTLIWECDFDTLSAAEQTLAQLLADNRHEDLFQKQSEYILGTHTEIYKPFDV